VKARSGETGDPVRISSDAESIYAIPQWTHDDFALTVTFRAGNSTYVKTIKFTGPGEPNLFLEFGKHYLLTMTIGAGNVNEFSVQITTVPDYEDASNDPVE